MVSTLAMTDALAKLARDRKQLRLARREKNKLSTGEEFEKLETTLSLMEQTTKEDREIGKIVYCEEMEAPGFQGESGQ